MSSTSLIVTAAICSVLQFFVFVLTFIAIPTDMLRSKIKEAIPTSFAYPGYRCYSMWGLKKCGPHKANPVNWPYKGFFHPNKTVFNIMTTAAAFSIIALVVALVAFALFIAAACKYMSMVPAMVLGAANFLFFTISCGCVLGVFHRTARRSPYQNTTVAEYQMKTRFRLGYGAIMLIVAWCVQFVIVFFALIGALWCAPTRSKANPNEPTYTAGEKRR